MEIPAIRKLALEIAAKLPNDCEVAKAVLGVVEDLLEWRGQVSEPASGSISLTSLNGSDETSPQ